MSKDWRGNFVSAWDEQIWFIKGFAAGSVNFYGQMLDHQDFFCWVGCCACGGRAIVRHGRPVTDCGCGISKLPQKADSKHPLYATWAGILSRCDPWYGHKDYGLRGIKVCDRWRNSFWLFVKDIGERPSSGHSLDRIDVNGDYEPKNVRWATSAVQARNKRTNVWIKLRGRAMTKADWCRAAGIDSYELWQTAMDIKRPRLVAFKRALKAMIAERAARPPRRYPLRRRAREVLA